MKQTKVANWISLVSWWIAAQVVLLAAAEVAGSRAWLSQALIALILSGLLYLGCQLLEIPRQVRLLGLLLLGGTLGSLLASWGPANWEESGTSALLIGAISVGMGLALGGRLPASHKSGWWWPAASWIYIFGWLLVWILDAGPSWRRAWAAAGAVLFIGLLAHWRPFPEFDEHTPDIPKAGSQLLLFSFNFAVCMLVLLAA